MPKRTRAALLTDRLNAKRTAIVVSTAGIPNGPVLDQARKVLPTPYAREQEWRAKTITGDWTSVKDGNAYIILVITDTDGPLVVENFRGGGAPHKIPNCRQESFRESARGHIRGARQGRWLRRDVGRAVQRALNRCR